MNLILFGFKGSGKSYFGKKISERTEKTFLDTDEILSQLYFEKTGKKRSAKEIYEVIGESDFRALEKRAVFSLSGVENCVIALGGGAVLDRENLVFLQKIGTMVYLKANLDVLQKRMFEGKETPAIFSKEDPYGSFFRLICERVPFYEAIPAETIDLDLLDEASAIQALCSIEDYSDGF